MEDIISLTPKQVKGLVWHLNEELYRQQVLGLEGRIITERLVELCVNCYNNTNIASSFEEQDGEQRELELVHGLKWSDKDYGKAFKDS
jgi:hypothetical protein